MVVGPFVGDVTQWLFCLVQITGLMLFSWAVSRFIQQKFPDIAASIGMIALAVSAILMVITCAGIPRPFKLSASTEPSVLITETIDRGLNKTTLTSRSSIESTGLLHRLVMLIQPSTTTEALLSADEPSWRRKIPDIVVGSALILSLLGGLFGVFRFMHSSIAIYLLARSSTRIDDPILLADISQILAKISVSEKPKDISVRKFHGVGSPFVSWMTGNTIYVPGAFPEWSKQEQLTSLAHEIGHLIRRDQYIHVVTQLAFYLTWVHPIAWVLQRQTSIAQELAADRMAAYMTENATAYCRGLSRLALRFDAECRQPSTVGVSVSSGLIRRINMLRKSQFHRLPCNRFTNRLATSLALIACSWIGCWSVAAQGPKPYAQVDSKVVPASHTSPAILFSQPATKPWETIGNQWGYISVQASRILNHPDLKIYQPILTAAFDSALRSESDNPASSKRFGLEWNNIESIQGGLLISYGFDANRPEGHRSRLSIGTSAVEVTALSPVDWPGLIKAIDLERSSEYFGNALPDLDMEMVQEAWVNSAKSGRSNVFQISSLMGGQAAEGNGTTATKKMLWNAVSGGAATVVYDIVQSGDVPADYKEADVFNQANLEMTLATQAAAWGVDFTPDYKDCQIRFAAVPKDDVSMDQFLEKFDAIRNAILTIDSDDDFAKHIIDQLKQASVSVVESSTYDGETMPGYLLVVGECSADIGKFGLIKNVSAPPRPQNDAANETRN